MSAGFKYRVLPHGVEPKRANACDAGLDLRYSDPWVDTVSVADIPPVPVEDETLSLGLGVSVAIPAGYVGLLTLRSSLARRGLRLANGVGVIDSGYRGEVAALVYSVGGLIDIYHGERIAQLVVVPAVLDAEEVDALPPPPDTRRGGFGSTGRA